ncbi:DUF4435 domain-containing protein [Aeromonas hydrophila]|uniref:DUF4435 domain-containing protein n=1 Tax=Aeromonas hydrophila TaxID=644 RepID=UPI002B48630B|nr:DUF4435 domain-containing protein [Aeromonas hydrophila]
MNDRLTMMMTAIKTPCVLRLKLIKNKAPGKVMFVFEGDDDYDFYFHALTLNGFKKDYSHINGSGKDQSVALFLELDSSKNEHLDNTYFFVDQDYSLFCHAAKNIMTLPFYAIENPLSDERVIKHFLTSTFRFDDKNKIIIDDAMAYYSQAKESFYSEIRELSIQLYMSRILGLEVEFPCNEDVFDKIEKSSVSLKMKSIDLINEKILTLSDDETYFYNAVCSLSNEQLTRGKYVYHFVSEWLIRIKKYIHNRIDNFNSELDKNIKTAENEALKELKAIKKIKKNQYEHKDLSIAKLVHACYKVPELDIFLSRI